ncbi:MAG: hypothetical protein RBS46_02575 [Methyloversatilis sp.]|jgi:hypothetical protein|nr:hypothetical protein [Methyloversatilis sp.]
MDCRTKTACRWALIAVAALSARLAFAEVTPEQRTHAIFKLAAAQFASLIGSRDGENARLVGMLNACNKKSLAELLKKKIYTEAVLTGHLYNACSNPTNIEYVLALGGSMKSKESVFCGLASVEPINEILEIHDGLLTSYLIGFSAAARVTAKEGSSLCEAVVIRGAEAIEN